MLLCLEIKKELEKLSNTEKRVYLLELISDYLLDVENLNN